MKRFFTGARPFLTLLLAATSSCSVAEPETTVDKSRENFMVVVRESIGANQQEDAFRPTGQLKGELPDGTEFEFEPAHWEYLGDTHIRFVFDQPEFMVDAMPADLDRLGISGVEEALALAVANIRRVYGEPSSIPWMDGIMRVEGESSDFNSSYFLDRSYWQELLREYPSGLVVSVASRGDLLYAPASTSEAVEALEREAERLYASSEQLRVSSALFLFKNGRWSVFEPPKTP